MARSVVYRLGVTVLVAVVVGTLAFFAGRSSRPPASTETLSSEREVDYWRAPMDPTEVYDSPGKSRMGMDLIPVYVNEAVGGTGVISIDPEIAQNMGVRTGRVTRSDFSRQIRTVGEVDYDEERLFLVNTKISGWIERLYVNYVGDAVHEGDPLMEIYSPELVSTQEEYLLAVQNVHSLGEAAPTSVRGDAERLLAAVRTRLEYWDIPAEEIDRLEETGRVSKTVRINAPATGIVLERNAIEGAFVNAGSDLFKIADLSRVWVHASFYDNEVPWLNVGQPVEMQLSYLPGQTYHGEVSYIYPYLREKARDVHVRLVFQNTSALDLKPGMYANVILQGRTIPDALTVPSEAVMRSGQRALAFVVRAPGKFEAREIRVGEIGGDGNARIRILDGLLEGEEIVTSAQFLLDSESRLQEAIQKMLSTRAEPEPGSGEDSGGSVGPGPNESDSSDGVEDHVDHETMSPAGADSSTGDTNRTSVPSPAHDPGDGSPPDSISARTDSTHHAHH